MWERRSYTLILKCSERKNWFYITIIILACHCHAVCYSHLLLVQLIWLIYNIVSFWVIVGLTKFSCPTAMPFLNAYTLFCLHISLSTCLRETSFRGSISVPPFSMSKHTLGAPGLVLTIPGPSQVSFQASMWHRHQITIF